MLFFIMSQRFFPLSERWFAYDGGFEWLDLFFSMYRH